MEVLDKINAASFGIQDMELLGMFARQAALAIDQAQQVGKIEDALILGLKRLASSDVTQDSEELSSKKDCDVSDAGSKELVTLEISELGDAERRVCLEILKAFAAYRRSATRRFGQA
jgi:GAF domain-containing protein